MGDKWDWGVGYRDREGTLGAARLAECRDTRTGGRRGTREGCWTGGEQRDRD